MSIFGMAFLFDPRLTTLLVITKWPNSEAVPTLGHNRPSAPVLTLKGNDRKKGRHSSINPPIPRVFRGQGWKST